VEGGVQEASLVEARDPLSANASRPLKGRKYFG
jgi:hypothetical protein